MTTQPPQCPECEVSMVLFTVRRGGNAGARFWGCQNYGTTGCRETQNVDPPQCPKCGAGMVLRTAKRGGNVGHRFWGCKNYNTTGCTETLQVWEHPGREAVADDDGFDAVKRQRDELLLITARQKRQVERLEQELAAARRMPVPQTGCCPHRHLLGVTEGRTAKRGRAAIARLLLNNRDPEAQRLMQLANVAHDVLTGR